VATLFVRRERWGFTWTGTLLALTVVAVLAITSARGLCGFLAINSPVGGQFLVVEGWMPVYAYREAAARFRNGGYTTIIAVGVIQEDWDLGAEPREHFGSELLVKFGVPGDRVVTVSSDQPHRDRTFHSAMAARRWLLEHGLREASVDVVTVGPHARRSRLLYEKAVGDDIKVGVIAVEDRRFDPDVWWRSSQGVRTVVDESIAYLYARALFWTPQ
jgi:uncharacterized SAM-binding protein YcdF (DUF218 family)